MTIIAADYSSHQPHNYRPVSVKTSFCCCCKYALFCPHRDRENKCHCDVTDLAKNIGIQMVSDFSTPYRKVTTLIPIALLPSMTAGGSHAVKEALCAMGISVVSTRCGSAKFLLIGAVLFFIGLMASC